jgi:hypothetical protein
MAKTRTSGESFSRFASREKHSTEMLRQPGRERDD